MPLLSFRAKSRNLLLLVSALLLGCAASTTRHHQPSLTRSEVSQIAKRYASAYRAPQPIKVAIDKYHFSVT